MSLDVMMVTGEDSDVTGVQQGRPQVAYPTADASDPYPAADKFPAVIVGSLLNRQNDVDLMTGSASDPNNRASSYAKSAKSDYGLNKSSFDELVATCRNVMKDEGLVARYVDMFMGLAAMGMENKFKEEVNEKYIIAFNDFAGRVNEKIPSKEPGLDEFQRKFAWEYWTSGVVVTIERWANMKMVKGSRGFSYNVPVEIDILDPTTLDLSKLDTEQVIEVKLTETQVTDIKKNGNKSVYVQIYAKTGKKAQKPTPDNPYPLPVYGQNDIVKMVTKDGKEQIPLPMENVRVFRRKYDDYSPYPVPYLASVLVPLADKSLLRESDRSVLSKIINMVMLYKVGNYNPSGQKVNVQSGLLKNAAQGFSDNVRKSQGARFMIQFIPESHDLSWVIPDVTSLMNDEKYRVANLELLSALIGFPAWNLMSNSGLEMDLLMKVVWSQYDLFTNCYKRFIERIYADIIERNNMRFNQSAVNLKPKRISLFDTDAFRSFRTKLFEMGVLSAKTVVEDAQEDWDTEKGNLRAEKELRESEGLLVPPATYAQMTVNPDGTPAGTPGTEEDGATPAPTGKKSARKKTSQRQSAGRPEGATDSEPRAPKET